MRVHFLRVSHTILSVHWSEPNGLVTYTLNRPKALNALNLDQVSHIEKEIRVLRENRACSGILFLGEGDKAFCAGGDVLHINKSSSDVSSDWNRRWFSSEFLLDYFISTLRMPVISIWRGIVMGGGVGLSIYGSHRVATDNTMFAMPETSIGFFPDVGGSWLLSHLVKPKGLGLFLGMTGHRLSGADTVHVGLATHFVPLDQIPVLISALQKSGNLDSTVNEYHKMPSSKLSIDFLTSVEKYFHGFTSFEELWDNLKSGNDEFAVSTVKTIRGKCPLTVYVWFESFKKGSQECLMDTFDREYKMCINVTETNPHNFQEGVRAQLIDKGKGVPPRYRPEKIEQVTRDMVDEVLKASEGGDLKQFMLRNKLMYDNV